MTTLNPSWANRWATAAPMPRDAPVTSATLLNLLVICRSPVAPARWGRLVRRTMTLSVLRIIGQNPAILSGATEQSGGQIRGHEGVYACGRATQLYAHGARSGTAALHGDGRDQADRGAAWSSVAATNHSACQSDARRRG